MGTFNYLLPLLFAFLLTACQVKEPKANGGLISGHAPTTNKFTIQPLATKTYVANETISFTLTFPFEMEITGSPRLRLAVGGNNRYADFVPSSDLRKLNFTYTFVNGDNDDNGIDVVALELNGATLQFDQAGTLTNCNVGSITNTNFSGVRVDTQAPTITGFNLMNLPGLYHAGDIINYVMTFSEAVFVTGNPNFTVTLNSGGSVNVNYIGGSGSNTLAFSFTVLDNYVDTNGYLANSPLNLAGGSILDSVGNAAILNFSAAAAQLHSQSVHLNGSLPHAIAVQVPANGTYLAAQALNFTVEFDRAVTVTGLPYLPVIIGANTREARYVSGSGTTQLVFSYTTIPGDVDLDGIQVTPSITANAGTIVGTSAPSGNFFAPGNNVLNIPPTTGIILSSLQPQAISVVRSTDNTLPIWGATTTPDNIWIIGQELNITVGFNTGMFVTQSNGTPSITLTIGSTPREALYLSGGDGQTSLVFRYVIQEGDFDDDGSIAISGINLNSGVIVDASNTNTSLSLPVTSLTTTRVDGIRPTITSVTAPISGTYSQVAPLNPAALQFTVAWSKAVNYSSTIEANVHLSFDAGGSNVRARYISGINTNSIIHAPNSLAGINDNDGITLSPLLSATAQIRDQVGNAASVFSFTAPTTTGILIDTLAPTVTSIVPITPDDTYVAGDEIEFFVTFSEQVTTNNISAGYPRIGLTVDAPAGARNLVATANTTSNTHIFRYTVQANDLDSNGIVLANAVVSDGVNSYIRDAGRNNVGGTFTLPSTTGIRIDAAGPVVASRTFTPAGTYVSDDEIRISLTFNEPVTVSGGTPTINLDFDQGTDNLEYISGSGSTTLVFSRTLGATHFDMTGLQSVSSINLNGATLQDALGNDAVITFTAIDYTTMYVTYPEVKLWVRSDFVNLAPAGGATVTSTGSITTESCGTGTGTCRTFNGDDSLSVNSLNNVETVFLVVRTPNPAPPVQASESYEIFDNDIVIIGDSAANAYDISTPPGTRVNGGTPSSFHNVNLPKNSTHVGQFDLTGAPDYSSDLIPTSFTGAIGEIIVVEQGLTNPQKANIMNYLDARY